MRRSARERPLKRSSVWTNCPSRVGSRGRSEKTGASVTSPWRFQNPERVKGVNTASRSRPISSTSPKIFGYSFQKPFIPASTARPLCVRHPEESPPGLGDPSINVTAKPCSERCLAAPNPAHPAPTTTTFFLGGSAGRGAGSVAASWALGEEGARPGAASAAREGDDAGAEVSAGFRSAVGCASGVDSDFEAATRQAESVDRRGTVAATPGAPRIGGRESIPGEVPPVAREKSDGELGSQSSHGGTRQPSLWRPRDVHRRAAGPERSPLPVSWHRPCV